MGNHDPKQPKDAWDKWAIVLSPVGGLFTGLAIAALAYFTSSHLGKWQEAESRSRLYTELMSRREQAETDVRKEMFKSIIDAFIKPPSDSGALGGRGPLKSLDQEVLKMELLAENFHDSLNLTPLFKELGRRLEERIDATEQNHDSSGAKENQGYLRRLQNLAEDVTTKQLAALENSDSTLEFSFDLHTTLGDPSLTKTQAVTVEKIQREITVTVTEIDEKTRALKISFHVKTLNDPANAAMTRDDLLEIDRDFWVTAFDFPMIDNTRLSHDQRCAVAVEFYNTQKESESTITAKIKAVCFPGSRTTFKEKPFYDEVLDKLQMAGTR